MLEIRYIGAIENNTIIRSVYSLLQHYQPQLAMARDEVQGDMCNLDKYLAAIRRQVELIAEFELTKRPSPRKQGDKKTTGNDRRKPRKDEDKPEGEAEDKKVINKKDKQRFMYRQGICSKGVKCPFKHDPKAKEQLVMMVEKRVQEALKGLQVKPEGAIEPTSEGAHEGGVDDDTPMLNMVMHVRTRALRSSVRQNKSVMEFNALLLRSRLNTIEYRSCATT